jgi:hypothetical protein
MTFRVVCRGREQARSEPSNISRPLGPWHSPIGPLRQEETGPRVGTACGLCVHLHAGLVTGLVRRHMTYEPPASPAAAHVLDVHPAWQIQGISCMIQEGEPMKTTLSIRWEGDTPDLVEHQLSLSAWLEPMGLLLKSVRMTASRILQDALDDPDAGRRGGRYAKAAQQIDLRLTAIRAGSTDVCFLVTGGEADAQVGLFPQLPVDLDCHCHRSA